MLECEATGKNIEQAIENALFELKALREDVDIKILEQGGLFKKAKVLVRISDDAVEKYQKVRALRDEAPAIEKTEAPKEEPKEEPLKTEEEPKAEPEAEKQEKIEVKKEHKPSPKTNESEVGKNFLVGLLEVLGNDAEVLMEENSNEIFYVVNGENASELVGYRGDGLNAIQYLISILNARNNRHSKKVRLDIDGFKERRKETLEALGHRIAKKVQRTGHPVKLEPMTAYERRIIHTVVQEYEGVSSHSEGEEPHRFLIVTPENKD